MAIFSNKNGSLKKLPEVGFGLEKEIQNIAEKNLKEIFNLEFVGTEFIIDGLRFDTLAFDEETSAFVIIEYKNSKNLSVIDQGLTYLSTLLNRKSDFVLYYNQKKNKDLKKEDVDWTQSRVYFVSPEFTKYQLGAIKFRDLPIQLWEAKKYQNEIILFNELRSPDSSESFSVVAPKSDLIQKVVREVKVYDETYHLKGKPDNVVDLYNTLKELVLDFGSNIQVRPRKFYIGFIGSTPFIDVFLQQSGLKLWINLKLGDIKKPPSFVRNVSKIGHHGNGDYEALIKTKDDLKQVMSLIVLSYQKHSA